MTAATTGPALRLLAARKLDASPANLAYANRRVRAAGRLALLGVEAMVPGLLRTRVLEHGEVDAMAPGTMTAECWLDARDITEWRQRAGKLLQLEQVAGAQGLRLVVAVHRASKWDRLRERLAWAVSR